MDFNGLRKVWIADRKHRDLFQLPGEEKEPQSTEGQRRRKIPDGRQGGRREFRPRIPEKIDQTHKNQPNGHAAQEAGVALQIARKQQKERNKKVEDDNNYRDHSPLAMQARVIESDLLWLVAGPDDQQLRKLEVSPEHHERQQQLAQIVNVARLKNAGKGAAAGEQHHDGNHQRHGRNELADHKQETVDGGCPVRRERHHPIDGSEGHNKDIDDDARAGQHLEPAVDGVVLWVGVLFAGPAIEQEDQNAPDREVQDGADAEAVQSQIAALEIGERAFLAGGRRVEPGGVEILHSEEYGHEKHGDDRQG